MNTFECAKKAKWVIKFIQKELSRREIKNVSIKYASLFLEEDEDVEVYEKIISNINFIICNFITGKLCRFSSKCNS